MTSPSAQYSWRFDQALTLASIAHAGTVRKGTKVPYITHPVHVARLLDRHGFSVDVVIAGLLHDVLEDARFGSETLQTSLAVSFNDFATIERSETAFRAATEAFIASAFGPNVFALVSSVTEVKNEGAVKRPWRQRKDEQIAHLSTMSRDQAALKAADALHNAVSILRDVERDGLDTLRRFNCSIEEILWYYGAVADGVRDVLLVQLKLVSVEPKLAANGPALFCELDASVLAVTAAVDKLLAAESGSGLRCRFCGARHDGNRCAAPGSASALAVESESGQRIRSLDHWFHLAPPAGKGRQWVNGRSARELARAWSGLSAPADVIDLLRRTDALHDFQPSTAIAELVTRLDGYGTGRNHDLVLLGTAGINRVVVGIEAKNDEELGPMIDSYLAITKTANDAKIAAGQPGLSKVRERVEKLTDLVFGEPVDMKGFRYQLLHGLGGTLIEAAKRDADIAVFLIQVFTSTSTNQLRAAQNEADISHFADLLARGLHHNLNDRLLGPVSDSRKPVRHIPFYFGVVRTSCADSIASDGITLATPVLSA